MTRPNALVLDGAEIKIKLEAERLKTGVPVHIDWFRFTVPLRSSPFPSEEVLFPTAKDWAIEHADMPTYVDKSGKLRVHSAPSGSLTRMLRALRDVPDADFVPAAQAQELAHDVAEILGDGFQVSIELRKGHDFYKNRWSIERNGVEVGWIGFGASSESPRQKSQAFTLHCNLYGAACTFAQSGWRLALADYIDDCNAKITRADLALDFFNGMAGGLDRVRDDWHAGLMNCNGKRPKANTVGPWVEGGRGRSFYFGSKEAGKQTNVYEKGVQLFGEKDATDWERIELRYGNKLRVLPSDILRRPADFFADASDWHRAQLELFTKSSIPAKGKLIKCSKPEAPKVLVPEGTANPDELRAALTVQAEVTRVVRWLRDTAGPSLTWAFNHLSVDDLSEIFRSPQDPQRLRRFTPHEQKLGLDRYLNRQSASLPRAKGKQAQLAHF